MCRCFLSILRAWRWFVCAFGFHAHCTRIVQMINDYTGRHTSVDNMLQLSTLPSHPSWKIVAYRSQNIKEKQNKQTKLMKLNQHQQKKKKEPVHSDDDKMHFQIIKIPYSSNFTRYRTFSNCCLFFFIFFCFLPHISLCFVRSLVTVVKLQSDEQIASNKTEWKCIWILYVCTHYFGLMINLL